MKWQDYITSDPQILAGKPIIKGTRLSIEFILNLLAEGWSVEQILENYPNLTPESLKAVFAFVAECIREDLIYDLDIKKSSLKMFLANENIPLKSIKILREKGYDVKAIIEKFPGISDKEVLKIAKNENRIILTFDRDYGKLLFKKKN